MKINQFLSDEDLDVWECGCGTYTPIKKGSSQPICELCRRRGNNGGRNNE